MIINLFKILLFFSPVVVLGAEPSTVNEIFEGFIIGNMKGLIPALILVGLVTFLAGVIKYVNAGDDEEKKSSGRMVMTYGIVILFFMVSAWGFVRIVYYTFFDREMTLPNYLPPLY